MKNKILFLLLFISKLTVAQQYDGLYIEKSKIDKNNSIYTWGKKFVFSIQIKKTDSALYLQENKSNTYKLSTNPDSLNISEVHLSIIKPRLLQRTNKRQTEVYYSYEPNPTTVSSTGLVENQKNIWIHPPRSGFFKSLETCPFPYIKLGKPIGYSWTDSMSISNHWSDKEWGQWEGRLLLTYDYKITEKVTIQSQLGEIDCLVINAVANTKLGASKLKAYYSYAYGFVKLQYTLFTGIEIELALKQVIDTPILRDSQDFFEANYK